MAQTVHERELLASIDGRFMTDEEDGPDGKLIMRSPTWRSSKLEGLLKTLKERECVVREEERQEGASAPCKVRRNGPLSSRPKPGHVAASARWALKEDKFRQHMHRVATLFSDDEVCPVAEAIRLVTSILIQENIFFNLFLLQFAFNIE